jgi:protein-disulfide isomerase
MSDSLGSRAWAAIERFSTLSIIGASVVFVWNVGTSRSAVSEPREVSDVSRLAELDLSTFGDAAMGSRVAKVIVLEFSDFQCPFCGIYARETFPKIKKEFIDTGKIQYVFRNFPLERIHPSAFKAAEEANCARQQGRFLELHDYLFSHQAALASIHVDADAKGLGLQEAPFDECLRHEPEVSDRVRKEVADGMSLGVKATPTFFIGVVRADRKVRLLRRLSGAKSYDDLKREVESASGGL